MLSSLIPSPLHPAIVHLPIALAVLVPAFALGALWAIRRGARPLAAWGITTALCAALSLSAWLAIQTGEQAEEQVESVVAEAPIETHEEAAEAFLALSVIVLGVAAVGLRTGRLGGAARVLGTVGTIALVGAGWNVGHSGGALVYRHGAARAYTDPSAAPGRELEALTDHARARLVAGDARSAAASLRAASRRLDDASRTEADSAAARALAGSARELLALAVGAEGGAAPSLRAVDAVVARARLADARMHHARVMPLVRNLRNAEAGIELLWAVDHLGRALQDAAPETAAGTAAVLDDARAAALRLTRPELGVPASTGIALERLAGELDRAERRSAPTGTPAPAVPTRA